MVDVQVAAVEKISAVLTSVPITLKHIQSCEFERTMILGIRILKEMVCSILGSGLEREKSLQLKKSWVKKFLSPSVATACACP